MKNRMRMALVGVAALTTVAGVALATRAYALPRESVVIFYFSDEAHSEVVGEKNITCNGFQSNWGIRTPYIVSQTEPCNSGCSPFLNCP